jgi:hypothetical protein
MIDQTSVGSAGADRTGGDAKGRKGRIRKLVGEMNKARKPQVRRWIEQRRYECQGIRTFPNSIKLLGLMLR